jgi:transposase
MSHANAALTPRQRLRAARLIVDQGWPVAQAAKAFNCAWPTANRWAERYAAMGEAGNSSRPHRFPNRTSPELVRKIVRLRCWKRLGPVQIGATVGGPFTPPWSVAG